MEHIQSDVTFLRWNLYTDGSYQLHVMLDACIKNILDPPMKISSNLFFFFSHSPTQIPKQKITLLFIRWYGTKKFVWLHKEYRYQLMAWVKCIRINYTTPFILHCEKLLVKRRKKRKKLMEKFQNIDLSYDKWISIWRKLWVKWWSSAHVFRYML